MLRKKKIIYLRCEMSKWSFGDAMPMVTAVTDWKIVSAIYFFLIWLASIEIPDDIQINVEYSVPYIAS